MLNKLKLWAGNAKPLLEGMELFDNIEIHKDKLYDELHVFAETGDPDMDTYTQVALEIILTGMILILERQAKDQLKGGKYYAPTESQKNSAANVPTTNTVSERDFAILDVLMRIKPSATHHAYETYILWLNNKPSAWLDSIDPTKKDDLLNKARHRYPTIREQYLKRKDKLKRQHIQALKTKQQKQEKKDDRSRLNKISATEALVSLGGGVWTQCTHINS